MSRRFGTLIVITALMVAVATSVFAPGATARPQSRIINGDAVSSVNFAARWPWIVSLVVSDVTRVADGQFCAGSLIGPKLVVTAAHCVSSGDYSPIDYSATVTIADPADVDVVAGRRTLTASDGSRIHASEIIVNKDYNPETNENDVALITLETAPAGITPIAVVGAAETALWGNGAGLVSNPVTGPWVAGWGDRSVGACSMFTCTPPLPADTLREAVVPIISDSACEDGGGADGMGYGRWLSVDSMMCAGVLDTHDQNDLNADNDGVDTCQGDSGGPLIVTDGGGGWRLAGITSWGFGCASRSFYGVYTRLDAMRAWIDTDPVAPVRNTRLPKVTGRKIVGKRLSCSRGTWTGGGTITYARQWYRLEEITDDTTGESYGTIYNKITGATASSYKLKKADKGLQLACGVTATNSSWEASVLSKPVGPIRRRA